MLVLKRLTWQIAIIATKLLKPKPFLIPGLSEESPFAAGDPCIRRDEETA
jgi:hypothetical protein